MPYYDYQCEDCGKIQTIKRSIQEIEENSSLICKYCHSKKIKRYYSHIAVISSPYSKMQSKNLACGTDCKCFLP